MAKAKSFDHLAKNCLHICWCKRSQGLCGNVSKGTSAQSQRSHGYIIWCVDDCDDVVRSQRPKYALHSRSALFPHVFEGSARFGESLILRIPWSVKLASNM